MYYKVAYLIEKSILEFPPKYGMKLVVAEWEEKIKFQK